jgi:hypothetical protein
MYTNGNLSRPVTLREGGEYLLHDPRNGRKSLAPVTVRFVSYHACPAFVVIATLLGTKQLCSRDYLYLKMGNLEGEVSPAQEIHAPMLTSP